MRRTFCYFKWNIPNAQIFPFKVVMLGKMAQFPSWGNFTNSGEYMQSALYTGVFNYTVLKSKDCVVRFPFKVKLPTNHLPQIIFSQMT